jgi:hypothetical protein
MPWYYRCEADYIDPNDLLHKEFTVSMASLTRLPQTFVVNSLTQKAYGWIQQYKLSPPDPSATKESLELELTFCEERES